MQVLPVGISVFGTITAITVVVVVLVTLERVRYRKVGPPHAMRSHLLMDSPTGIQGTETGRTGCYDGYGRQLSRQGIDSADSVAFPGG